MALLGTAPDAEVARAIGRAKESVRMRRSTLGILPAGGSYPAWRPEELALVGTGSDAEIAARIGRSIRAVARKRRSLSAGRRQDPRT